jgi:hypothetical protein
MVLRDGQRSSKGLRQSSAASTTPLATQIELVNTMTSCSNGAQRSSYGARRCSEELGRDQTELGSICHSIGDPTKLVNASTSISYCPHRFVYLTDGFS